MAKSIFDHPFFRKAPAMASLEKTQEPKPEHVRACLMEMARYMTNQRAEVDAPAIKIEEANDGFAITIGDKRWNFDQEDNKKKLVDVFKALGFKASYEEAY